MNKEREPPKYFYYPSSRGMAYCTSSSCYNRDIDCGLLRLRWGKYHTRGRAEQAMTVGDVTPQESRYLQS